MAEKITIIDYGTCNVKSVANMLRKAGADSEIASDPGRISTATKLILPGIGSFDQGMKNLEKNNLIPVLNEKVLDEKTPILGICLGMQLLANLSEEGESPGFGWIDGKVKKFDFSEFTGKKINIPHMGWNKISRAEDHFLFRGVKKPMRFYFVHSYHYVCNNSQNILAETSYGYDFTCAVIKDNIMGVQFHPEKSHKYGMQVLRNFVENL